MNLIIEQGNTSTKVAIYQASCMIDSFLFKAFDLSNLMPLFDAYHLDQGIFCSVVDVDHSLVDFLRAKLNYFVWFDQHTLLPIQVEYKTPETLGKDRIGAVVGAVYFQPNRNLLVIDAGTAITYEFVESSGTYLGGNISPGLTTRFKALNYYTKKLPLVQEADEIVRFGVDTVTAIRAGVVNGIVYEMDGYIADWKQKYPDLLVFLTGGDSFYFERRLKNSIFADINLVLAGLNRILEYNVENKESTNR